ncbi:hypothetical protein [Nocardioides marmorisolisilvae]|uniref:Uncharacterized protein n=1 Tax=Nocardioides marmorisolisilvae TaxID=1542737 RepID=A0A3N0DUL6_9ACTN|nr:hypothetical protein [Nocardioides marmorisolisilvae]RNL79093.1 hypothetical protein EFL95_08635 [Nocardioides marmorisolisilvae]
MSSREEEARRAREDADWQAFVDSYGERPEFPEEAAYVAPVEEHVVELPPELAYEDAEDGYVPPPPPPLQRPHGLRALAWFGLFGVPAIVLLCIMVNLSLPSMLSLLFLAWFVGGFGYLVATMSGPKDPDAGWDDGAVL